MTKTRLCIYHGGCTDGIAAAWAMRLKHRDAIFYPGVYQEEPPWHMIDKSTEVYVLDFSYKRDVMRMLAEAAEQVFVIDHHDSAERELMQLFDEGVIDGIFDQAYSGAMLSWNWFHDSQPPALFHYIMARDLWLKKTQLPCDLDYVISAVRSYSHSAPVDWPVWDAMMSCPVDMLEEQGAHIHRYYRQLVDAYKAEARLVEIRIPGAVHRVMAVNCPYQFASEVAGELADDAPAKWAFCYWQNGDGDWVHSLRSNGVPEVNRIAEHFGGGGHPGAAGFKLQTVPWFEVKPVLQGSH